MKYRTTSRAVSGIATSKNNAASPAFYICYPLKKRGKPRGIHDPAPGPPLPPLREGKREGRLFGRGQAKAG
jgi:hypothetical protein